MKLREIKCFLRSDLSEKLSDTTIVYLQSGFAGHYLEIYEDASYSLGVKYVGDPKIVKKLDAVFGKKK